MLINFKVKNFRSIQDEIILDLQATSDKTMKSDAVFDCGKVSLLKCAAIYGANASGKTNILKAFMVFRGMVLESLLRSNLRVDLSNEAFKLNEGTENKPSYFEIKFILEKEIFSYGFSMDKKCIISEWLKAEQGNKDLFIREKQAIQSNKNYFSEASEDLKKQVSERVLLLSLLASHNKPISQKIMQFMQNTDVISGAERGRTLDYSFGQFLNNPDIATKMKDFIVKADFGVADIKASQKMITAQEIRNIPDKFKELLFKENSKIAERSLKFFHKKYNQKGKEVCETVLDFFTEESAGTQQMFALSAPVIDSLQNKKVLLIDELEYGFHPTLCQYLVSIFNSKEKNPHNAQFIFTTHAVSLLDEDLLRRDEIYITNKNKKGATELFSLADISERKGVNFAKRYLEGRYKGIPYIDDFENLKLSKQV
jgi:hypothetical protein